MNVHSAALVSVLLSAGLLRPLPARGRNDSAPPPAPPRAPETLLDHLRAAKPPVFRAGHTLHPLSRWGWSMPFEVRVELAEKWGYALEFGGYLTHEAVDDVEKNPNSVNARIVALTARDPARYPLFVLTHRPLGGKSLESLPAPLRAAYYCRDADGKPIPDTRTKDGPGWRTISPLAPDAIFEWAAKGTVEPLLRLQRRTPLAVILNGGEYGLPPEGHGRPFWEQDPAVMAAKGDRTWLSFISAHKARQERIITRAVREAFPDRRLYLWYHFGGIPSWDSAAWSFDHQLLEVSDYPDQSLYYLHYNTGWSGTRDLLSNFTFALAQASPLGHPLSYNWVCGGWKTNEFSEPDRYMGFLKCLYAAGQIGAVAGYFSHPQGADGKPVGPTPPPHLVQMMALGHVHALFSHVEDHLRNGDLLPGPLRHARNPEWPAYEFADPAGGARVFVRKHRARASWLIAAWAATGESRNIEVAIPGLGPVSVLARPAGSVYLAAAAPAIDYEPPVIKLDLLDDIAMDPAARWR